MIYDSATVFFRSGTGNSLRVAMWMAAITREAGVPATVSASCGAAPAAEVSERLAGLRCAGAQPDTVIEVRNTVRTR